MITITCNKKMIQLLLAHRNCRNNISPELLNIVQDGFIIKEDCILLRSFYQANRKHVKIDYFDDLTEYETFLNGFMINDFCKNDYLKNGYLFVNLLCEMIDDKYPDTSLEMVLCKSSKYFHFTMHTIRTEEKSYLENNLESYLEPTMVIRHLVN